MWNIQFEDNELYAVLNCEPDSSSPNPKGITQLHIYNWQDERVQLIIQSTNESFIEDLIYRIQNIDANLLLNVSFMPILNLTFDISVSITSDLQSLIAVLNILDDRIHNFSQINHSLSLILNPSKADLISAHKNHMLETAPKFESQGENTMRASLRATTRTSEIALRAKYNFPAPMYSCFFTAPTPTPTPPLYNTGNEDDNEEEESADSDVVMDGGQIGNVETLDDFDNTTEYDNAENEAITKLISMLESKQANLIRRGFLIREYTGRIILSALSIQILTEARSNPDVADLDLATRALNIKTCIRALAPHGSHSHNREMYRTGIVGYGMRNLTALMWHSCIQAKETKSFMIGVSFGNAINALINGIANGARAGNRNEDLIDDLSETDMPPCDAGKYNSLITAFNGILPEINIIYNYIEYLLQELKQEIINILIDDTLDYSLSRNYLTLWLGSNDTVKPIAYLDFVDHVKEDFPNMIARILDNTSPHDPILKEQIELDIQCEIRNVEEINFGLKFIEIVSPTVGDLDTAWQQRFPHDTSPADHAAALELVVANQAPPAAGVTRVRKRLAM